MSRYSIELRNMPGTELLCRTEIHCSGEPPPLVEWDDSPDGARTFLHVGGRVYHEQPAFLLSIGEVIPRTTASLTGSVEK